MLIADYQGIVTSVNPSARRILDLDEPEMVGEPLYVILLASCMGGDCRQRQRLYLYGEGQVEVAGDHERPLLLLLSGGSPTCCLTACRVEFACNGGDFFFHALQ